MRVSPGSSARTRSAQGNPRCSASLPAQDGQPGPASRRAFAHEDVCYSSPLATTDCLSSGAAFRTPASGPNPTTPPTGGSTQLRPGPTTTSGHLCCCTNYAPTETAHPHHCRTCRARDPRDRQRPHDERARRRERLREREPRRECDSGLLHAQGPQRQGDADPDHAGIGPKRRQLRLRRLPEHDPGGQAERHQRAGRARRQVPAPEHLQLLQVRQGRRDRRSRARSPSTRSGTSRT